MINILEYIKYRNSVNRISSSAETSCYTTITSSSLPHRVTPDLCILCQTNPPSTFFTKSSLRMLLHPCK